MNVWRTVTPQDIAVITAIAGKVHPGFFEDEVIFSERRDLYPEGAKLLEQEGKAAGYVLSHPWRYGDIPALNTLLGALPVNPSTYYLHDLALLPSARGTGAAGEIVSGLSAHAAAKNFPTMSLVAVNASRPFWEKHGFEAVNEAALTAKLATYGERAFFMVKKLENGASGRI